MAADMGTLQRLPSIIGHGELLQLSFLRLHQEDVASHPGFLV